MMDNPTMQNNEPMISSAIVSGMIALVVSLAFDIRYNFYIFLLDIFRNLILITYYIAFNNIMRIPNYFSGGMFNPMLATVLLGGCKGNTTIEHIAIYWIGASVGAILAYFAYPRVKQMVYSSSQNEVKQETKVDKTDSKKMKSS